MTMEDKEFCREGVLERIRAAKAGIESSIQGYTNLKDKDPETEAFYTLAIGELQDAADSLRRVIMKAEAQRGTQGTPIEELGLSVRAWRCLDRAGIATIEELLKKTPNEVKKIRNLGAQAFLEITDALEKKGMELRRY